MEFSYTLSADGLAVRDNRTDLTWQRSPDTNGDRALDARDKLTLAQARESFARLSAARFGGFADWRLPNVKIRNYVRLVRDGATP